MPKGDAMKRYVRIRWGVEVRGRGEAWSGPLGAGWVSPPVSLPACIDFWPASWGTRTQARAAAQALAAKAHVHSPGWQFRALRLTITVRA